MTPAEPNDASQKAPERAWVFNLNVQGDSREDACMLLQHFLEQIERGSMSLVSGGYSSGGILTGKQNPGMTHDAYTVELEKYLEERDQFDGGEGKK